MLSLTIFNYSIFGVYANYMMIARHNKTINEIEFEKNGVTIKTFEVFWLKSKIFSSDYTNFKLEIFQFPWYGKTPKAGQKLILDKEEYFLVKDYFDDYENILNHFPTANNS